MNEVSSKFKRTFTVRPVWDDEAQVFYCESDIDGLHIEAKTLEEFEQLIDLHAVDLVIANHFNAEDFATRPMRELVPAIKMQPPEGNFVAA